MIESNVMFFFVLGALLIGLFIGWAEARATFRKSIVRLRQEHLEAYARWAESAEIVQKENDELRAQVVYWKNAHAVEQQRVAIAMDNAKQEPGDH